MKFYIGYFMMLVGILIAVFLPYIILSESSETEIVDCFDRYGNQIIGERCIDEPFDKTFSIILAFGASIWVVAMGAIMVSIEKMSEVRY